MNRQKTKTKTNAKIKIAAWGWVLPILIFVLPAQASVLTNFIDTPSNQITSTAANHELSFTASSGASDSKTVVATFASAFDTSTIDLGDLDLEVGAVDRTLAANCSGTEQLSASIASDVITFTVCAGDGGSIPAASNVVIKIGTNATTGGLGDAQIINPGVAGSFTITVGGSFGDRGAVALGITSPGSVTVSATKTTGGGGPSPGCGDTTAPIISSVQASSIAQTSADITWQTNEASDSRVDYGPTTSYGGNIENSSLLTSHSLALSGLTSGALYHYQVRSRDLCGNTVISSDFTFTTLSPTDSTPPTISDIRATSITGTGATIVWITNETATSLVDYGLTPVYELGTLSNLTLVTEHSVNLIGLTSETVYHFRVRSADGSGNSATSTDQSFTTVDIIAPIISAISVVDITQSSARVTWTTSEPATSLVAYGSTTAYEIGTVSNALLVTSHSLTISGLRRATAYHYQVRSSDGLGNNAQSIDAIFTTLPDTTPPANISGFTAIETTPGTIRLSWTNPIDSDFVGVKIVRRTDRFPTSSSDGTGVFDGLGAERIDSGLNALTTYYYGVFAYDSSGNEASGALAQVTTSPICGDGSCSAGESVASCPSDCRVAPAVCGNDVCDSGESSISCPSDCQLPSGVVCGNGYCETGESITSCPADCRAGGALCGNGTCEDGETSVICPLDCPLPPPICDNAVCDAGETNQNCPVDCPIIVMPSGPSGGLSLSDLHLLVNNEQIELLPTGNTYDLLINTALVVRINESSLAREPQEVRLVIGQSAYLLGRRLNDFSALITTEVATGRVSIIVSVIYPDGTNDRIDAVANMLPWGQVRAAQFGTSIPNVLVNLLNADGTIWEAVGYGAQNPILTNGQGLYAWYAPNGSYKIIFKKDGYRDAEINITTTDYIINSGADLIILPRAPVETVRDIVSAPISAPEKIVDIGSLIGEQIDYGYEVARREIIDNPQVERVAEDVTAPTVAVVATASAAAAASTVGIANLIRFLFTQPVVFFARRKKKAWGIVYNAITKVPVGLTVVRLYDLKNNRLIQSRVTDRDGKYFFIVQPGSYRLEAQKNNFVFPSKYLQGLRSDAMYFDLYHGEPIIVTEQDATIAANIPLDPQVKVRTPAYVTRIIWWNKIQSFIAIVSPIIAGVTVIISPSTLTIGLFLLQVLLYVIFRWVIRPKKPKGWGIVYDAKTRKPLSRAIVRIFEPVYGKLLEMQVTDSQGRYSFVVGPNLYKLASEKTGYEPVTRELDFKGKKEPEAVKEDLHLVPQEKKEIKPETVSESKDDWKHEPV